MTNPNKRRGSRFECALRDHLHASGFPHAAVTRAGYARDWGDLHPTGDRDIVIQAKNHARWDLAGWLRQLADQITGAGARHGVLVVKRRGASDPGRSYAVLELDAYLDLLRAAGYGQKPTQPQEPAPDQRTDGAA